MGLLDDPIEKAGKELDATVDDAIARLLAGAEALWAKILAQAGGKKITLTITLEDK